MLNSCDSGNLWNAVRSETPLMEALEAGEVVSSKTIVRQSSGRRRTSGRIRCSGRVCARIKNASRSLNREGGRCCRDVSSRLRLFQVYAVYRFLAQRHCECRTHVQIRKSRLWSNWPQPRMISRDFIIQIVAAATLSSGSRRECTGLELHFQRELESAWSALRVYTRTESEPERVGLRVGCTVWRAR